MKKRPKNLIYALLMIGIFSILAGSCKKDDNNNNTSNTVTDEDGNVYTTVTIGTQVWMVENLKTTTLNDGTSLSTVSDNASWSNLSTPGYCFYNDAGINKNTYGALYNYLAVKSGKLAPQGWHVPTDAEWTILITYLGGENAAGGLMKSTGTFEASDGKWLAPNTGATNESGFLALPGGYRDPVGVFFAINNYGNWWSTTASTAGKSFYCYLHSSDTKALGDIFDEKGGFSVRCVKD